MGQVEQTTLKEAAEILSKQYLSEPWFSAAGLDDVDTLFLYTTNAAPQDIKGLTTYMGYALKVETTGKFIPADEPATT